MKTIYRILQLSLLALTTTDPLLAQWLQTNGLSVRQVTHHPLMGTNVFQETLRELLGLPVQREMQPDFIRRVDSLRAWRTQLPFLDERHNLSGIQRSSLLLNRSSSPRPPIYVIDTAIVRATWDTTRHLYSFNTKAKKTSDLTQKLTSDLWMDSQRHTSTYNAHNNMYSDLYEHWSDGQWVNGTRSTYTYDANGYLL